jgi:hypothetical protein
MVAVNVTGCPKTVKGVLELILPLDPEWLTSWLTVLDVEESKPASPEYTAVMEWLARMSDDVDRVAIPPARAAVPIGVPPSKKETVPVAPGVTVAVNVTDWPKKLGLVAETRLVVLETAIADVAATKHKKANRSARRVANCTCLRRTVLHQ